jgi:hypothetical protein
MRPKPRCQRLRTIRRAQQIRQTQKRHPLIIQPRHQHVIPQRIEVGATLVEDLGEVGVQVLGVEMVARAGVVFAHGERLEEPVEILHVGDVAAEADDAAVAEGADAFDGGEAGEGPVGGWGGLVLMVGLPWRRRDRERERETERESNAYRDYLLRSPRRL